MNDDELLLIYQNIINDKKTRPTRHQKLIEMIDQMINYNPQFIYFNNTMRYSKGQNQGNLISPFLQKKALDFVNSSLYKAGQNSNSLIQDNKVLQKQITKLERSDFCVIIKSPICKFL